MSCLWSTYPSSLTHRADREATDWQPKSSQRIKRCSPVSIISFNPCVFPPLTTNLLIHWNRLLFPVIYQLSPSQTQSVSVSQPLSSTSALLLSSSSSLPAHHVASTPPPPYQHPAPLGEPCQSQAYKRGLDVGLGGQPAPLCTPAHWRMKLACGGPSMAMGHSRQPGSSAWPALHPIQHHWAPANCTPTIPHPWASCQ